MIPERLAEIKRIQIACGPGLLSNMMLELISEVERLIPGNCNCHCIEPGMWHDQGCPMRRLPEARMWGGVR